MLWQGRKKLIPFLAKSGEFHHPSVDKSKSGKLRVRQGLVKREDKCYARICQWQFPDTATFKSDMLSCSEAQMNSQMEKYAELVLVLFMPLRNIQDLQPSHQGTHPFVRKLQEVSAKDESLVTNGSNPIVFNDENISFLQNIQNSAYNSLRYKVGPDPLEKLTDPFTSNQCHDMKLNAIEEEDDDEIIDYECVAELFDMDEMDDETTKNVDHLSLADSLQGITLKHLKNKGENFCGHKQHDVSMDLLSTSAFVTESVNQQESTNHVTEREHNPSQRCEHTMNQVVKLLLKRTQIQLVGGIKTNKQFKLKGANGSVHSLRQWGKTLFEKDKKQRRAFESIVASFLLTFFDKEEEEEEEEEEETRNRNRQIFRRTKLALLRLKGNHVGMRNEQLIALLHGPGGSGKSHVLNAVKAYARSFCEELGHPHSENTIVVTAMSGIAATLMHGTTTHCKLGLNRNSISTEMTEEFADTRLIVIDEMSFAGACDFEKIHNNCCTLMCNNYSPFGGVNIVFCGDFSQLEPVGPEPMHNEYCAHFHGKLNMFFELDGHWRCKDDPIWGERLLRFREGNPTLEDVETINRECSLENNPCPPDTKIATHKNRNRDAINTNIFESICKKESHQTDSATSTMIFMDDLCMRDSAKTYTPVGSKTTLRNFYEHCGENDVKVSGRNGRADPVLKVHKNCRLMLTKNVDVARGQANGSCVRLEQIVMKQGELPFTMTLENGASVLAMHARQVEHLIVVHENNDTQPSRFEMESETFTFTSALTHSGQTIQVACKGLQFPVISNSCTTGHKLQGCTCESLLVNEWCHNGNWPCVVLSRVTKMKGLHLREPLDTDLTKCAMPAAMKTMSQEFRNQLTVPNLDEHVHKMMIEHEIQWQVTHNVLCLLCCLICYAVMTN